MSKHHEIAAILASSHLSLSHFAQSAGTRWAIEFQGPTAIGQITPRSLNRPFQRVLVRIDRIHAVFPQIPDESGYYQQELALSVTG